MKFYLKRLFGKCRKRGNFAIAKALPVVRLLIGIKESLARYSEPIRVTVKSKRDPFSRALSRRRVLILLFVVIGSFDCLRQWGLAKVVVLVLRYSNETFHIVLKTRSASIETEEDNFITTRNSVH